MTAHRNSPARKGIGGDSCGCATGAIFLGVALALSGAWYGWHWHTSQLSPGAMVARIVGFSFAASIVGKLIGMALYTQRSRRPKPPVVPAETLSKLSQLNAAPPHGTDAAK